MKSILVVLLSAFATPLHAEGNPTNNVIIASVQSVIKGRLAVTKWGVDRKRLENQPPWRSVSQEIPLSISKASSNAVNAVKQSFPNIKQWRFESIYLRPIFRAKLNETEVTLPHVWFYQITVVPSDEDLRERLEENGRETEFTQVVLMDGSLVLPLSSKP